MVGSNRMTEILEKLSSFNDSHIYLKDLMEYEVLEVFYDFLVLNPGNYLESMQNITLFEINNSLVQLTIPTVKDRTGKTNCSCIGNRIGKLYQNYVFF